MAKKVPTGKVRKSAKSSRANKGATLRSANLNGAKEAEITQLYTMSRSEAAKLVKRAGIVTKSGNLATLFR